MTLPVTFDHFLGETSKFDNNASTSSVPIRIRNNIPGLKVWFSDKGTSRHVLDICVEQVEGIGEQVGAIEFGKHIITLEVETNPHDEWLWLLDVEGAVEERHGTLHALVG